MKQNKQKTTKRANKQKNKNQKNKNQTKKRKQYGSGLFTSKSKKLNKKFNESMKHFCEVMDNGNNIPKKNKVLRESVHKVCNDFYEAKQASGGGIIGGTFNFVTELVKKPVVYVSNKVSSLVSSKESENVIPPLKK